jgi:hypothetical protein
MTETQKQGTKQAARGLCRAGRISLKNSDMGHEERRVYQGGNGGMAGTGREVKSERKAK